ncbi:MAG: hypothetical protein GY719_35080, partial [bacterium]|nr:hypothetical protein [bacterium]
TELLGDYFEALQDTARSPIQRKKQPLRYMDRSTSALNDEELESHLLASRPGLRDDTGKANAAGQALLKQYRGEQAFDVLDQDREVALVNSLIERAKQSQNPAAAMQALEVVLGRIEDDMRGVPLPDQAAAGIVSQASLNINRTAPVTSSQISGSPSDFSFFGNQRTNLDVSEQAQMQGARGALEQGLPVTSGHLDSIDPAILGENQMARSLIDEGGFRLSYDLDADGKVSRVEVVPPSQGGLPTMQLGGVADAITQKLNANTGTVAQAAGIAINRGTAGGNDTRAMGQPFTAPEPPTAERDAPGAAAVPQTGPEPPEPENYYESLRRQLKGGR